MLNLFLDLASNAKIAIHVPLKSHSTICYKSLVPMTTTVLQINSRSHKVTRNGEKGIAATTRSGEQRVRAHFNSSLDFVSARQTFVCCSFVHKAGLNRDQKRPNANGNLGLIANGPEGFSRDRLSLDCEQTTCLKILPVIVDRACGASFVRKYRRARNSGNVNFSVGHCYVCTD